jgi:hypothetical protein
MACRSRKAIFLHPIIMVYTLFCVEAIVKGELQCKVKDVIIAPDWESHWDSRVKSGHGECEDSKEEIVAVVYFHSDYCDEGVYLRVRL